ncbi:NAD-glutamate dehydrogenase [Pseudomonas oryzae]|uniref:Glutamate dehydrogenase (NAD) n=1 Tax=Pseudomonas oryzae TaxID=1392877 RepID=A0A1H1M0N7_9PSED|nr:NAD-glutamate dehydrogenase [Pseudomonas oryzae]SDR80386.1 glutamate dehydrogenase (NAD) [Pseudomonas oryzae]
MGFFTAADRDDFHRQLQEVLARQVGAASLDQVLLFARQFFAIVGVDELSERRLADLAGCCLSAWKLLERFDPQAPQVVLFSPDYERHGWQSPHTVLQVLHADMPFLVDSLHMELRRRGHTVHSLQNCVLSLRRGASGELLEVLEPGVRGPEVRREALISLEIDRCASAGEQHMLAKALHEVLADVRLAVGDFAPMQARVRALLAELQPSCEAVHEHDCAEVGAFLEWMLDNHFTFLGYEEFSVESREDGSGLLVYDEQALLGLSRRLRSGLPEAQRWVSAQALAWLRAPSLLSFAKADQPARVHRSAYPDYVSLRQFDEGGRLLRECRFIGLYTSPVYTESMRHIPCVRGKVAEVERRAGFEASAHLGKSLVQVLEVLPRDDLFQTPVEELTATAVAIVQLQERNRLRLFLRRDPFGHFCYCLVYVPREIYSTEIRLRIERVLRQRLGASDCEFWTWFSESVLARVQFILRVDPHEAVPVDPRSLEQEVVQACRSWQDDCASLVVESFGEAQGTDLLASFAGGFPASYRERFEPHMAVVDLRHLLGLSAEQPLAMSFYQPSLDHEERLHCKIYHADAPLPLSDMLPILENLGLRVLGEFPYRLRRQDGREFWIHDYTFTYAEGISVDLQQLNVILQDAFIHIVQGVAENDGFNRLVLGAGLPWREVALLRAYGRYLKQIRLGFDLGYIAATLNNHADIARELVRLFKTRFYLARKLDAEQLQDKQQRLEQAILGALERVQVLNEDRILRRYLELVRATLRSNFYQAAEGGGLKDYLSFKLDPQLIGEMPRPVPRYEIFVYSPRVEGVHLRGGKVARGGLRWSDREEDYRTEVLGLVKAQQVKNAVIVPVGAKGGFVPRRLPLGGTRDEIQAEAIACYRIFVSGLLDLTDNLVDGQLLPPPNVVRHDEDDPYLVVAADKGTATFSDIANALAADYGFWLDDAFASGGSAGYDHKGMGITARGAWVGVQRHFRERGIDVQQDSISVVGIGDMAGDVFGNGLLRSDRLLLIGAFNHLHIFLDPDPDPAASFAERQRLFDLPRSTWADYDAALISAGGGVYPRSAKSIPLSPQIRERLGIDAEQLAPNELISALLRAPVDLLWNGGIGTYVKSVHESHTDVGDKANDAVRVNGRELRCKVVGEGGNLGMTQLGRVEYCLNGGACNTDFIDNAGGVTCSDHEVNIKILLGEVVRAGDLTLRQRNELLREMTEAVAQLVLNISYRQVQALSLAQRYARGRLGEFRRLMMDLESRGRLDRALEFLPADEELNARAVQHLGLTRPELALLLSYSKFDLKEALLHSSLVDDPYLLEELHRAFPAQLVERFPAAMEHHRLRREIVSTRIANDLVDHMGMTFVQRLNESTGLSPAHIAAGWVVVRDLFELPYWWQQIEALDHRIDPELQLRLMEELMRLGRRATRWLLRNRRGDLDLARDVAHFAPSVRALSENIEELLEGPVLEAWQARRAELEAGGVPPVLARQMASGGDLYTLLPIIEAADVTGQPPMRVAACYYALFSELELGWYLQQLHALPVENNWQALARESLRDELDAQQRALTIAVLQMAEGPVEVDERLTRWLSLNQPLVARWRHLLAELRASSASDYAVYAVANRELQDLAQSVLRVEGDA